ncbi:hypothetical protein J7T55_002069 [Diaporthe amygdali]|uniref:uncharacterized protein n=1 Tax=Phomopsis amygdali TaxID=1214568 RepID=UPI0022FE1981|nr:uncharacterized protein J7T55_002069 [Diaporthe amygdali]KAJ0108465.1 hypothetical protein J7T55_002069 [Diaporthe amygdali]
MITWLCTVQIACLYDVDFSMNHKSRQRTFAAAPTSAPGPDGQCPGNTNDSFQQRLVLDAYGSQAPSDDPEADMVPLRNGETLMVFVAEG